MKGIIFTELLTMAEDSLGEEAVDEVLEALTLDSDGAYSRVGNYPCSELISLVDGLSRKSGLSMEHLQHLFGAWMLKRFHVLYPNFFKDKANALEMLAAIEDEVHVEVRKLYPDAELPRFDTQSDGPGHLRMRYLSDRPLVSFCEGLITACAAHFNNAILLDVSHVSDREAIFDITLVEAPEGASPRT